MASVKRTAQAVSERKAVLIKDRPNGIVPIISVEHPDMVEHRAGVVFVTGPKVAAQMITKRTHREASDEEYADYKQDQAERTDELRRQELEKKGVTTMVSPVVVGRPGRPAKNHEGERT